MDPDAIKDRKSLEVWLTSRPQADAIAIAYRAALRVAPIWIANDTDSPWRQQASSSALPAVRLLLTSGVARRYPSPEIMAAARAARVDRASFAFSTAASFAAEAARAALFDYVVSVDFDASDAAFAAEIAAKAANEAATQSAIASIWSAVRVDAEALATGQDLNGAPIWQADPPEWWTLLNKQSRALWETDPAPETWSFWLRWWDGALSGNQRDWELQKQVALIPDDIWLSGPAAVAEAIRQIELDFAISATPNAEDIARDEHGLFYTLPVSTIRPALFRAAIEKVQDDLTEIRAAPRMANCLAFLADDLRRLDDHFVRYADQPLRIHDVYLKTLRHIEALQRQGLLPADTLIEDLHHDLDTGAVDIRRSDNEVAKTVKARIGDRLARLKADRRDETEAAVNGAAAESRDALKEELKQDFATATDPAAETEDKEESGYRLFAVFCGWERNGRKIWSRQPTISARSVGVPRVCRTEWKRRRAGGTG